MGSADKAEQGKATVADDVIEAMDLNEAPAADVASHPWMPGPDSTSWERLKFWLLGSLPRGRSPTGGWMPEPYIGFFSRATYHWMEPFVLTGNRRPLDEGDLFILENDMAAENMAQRLQVAWDAELKNSEKPHLWRAIWAAFKWDILNLVPYRVISDTIAALSPLLVLALVRFLANTGTAVAKSEEPPASGPGYAYAISLGLLQMVAGWTTHKFFDKAMRAGFRVRSALTAALYNKCLRLSPKGRQSFSSGTIVNIMATDVSRMERGIAFLNLTWSVPYLFFIAMGLLIYNLGVSAVTGLALLLLLAPFQIYAMKYLATVRGRASGVTDQRVKVTQEALTGVRVMKMYAWEESFLKSIGELRKKELVSVRMLLLLRGGISTVTTVIPAFAAIASFGVYSATGGVLDAPRVFSSLALFNVLRIPCLLIPIMATELTDAKVGLDRLNSIMVADELDSPPEFLEPGRPIAINVKDADFAWENGVSADDEDGNKKGGAKKAKKGTSSVEEIVSPVPHDDHPEHKKDAVLTIEDADLHTEGVSKTELDGISSFTLRDINISVPRGHLVAIVGVVGSGKSSLLNGMVGEMKRLRGSVEFSGTVGYCPQSAWIQNATLRDNILFGAPMDEAKYAHAIRSCALERDLEVLPGRDDTEIGERGINLSGGQRQRVSLARAVYFDADIVILDDPLSAVDAHVGKYLFENCICGALGGKTRILVTHALHFLPQVNHIYLMDNGRIAEQGSYSELVAKGGIFTKLIQEYGNMDAEESKPKTEEEAPVPSKETPIKAPEITGAQTEPQKKKNAPAEDITKDGELLTSKGEKEPETAKKRWGWDAERLERIRRGILMTKEARNVGSLKGKVITGYGKAAGGIIALIIIILLLIIAQLARLGTDLWITWWSGNRFLFTNDKYLHVYIAWGFIQVVTALASAMTFAFAGITAAQRLHDRSLAKVFRASTEYFDTTPLGRILNRFSKDVDSLDSLVPESSRMVTYTFSLILGTVGLICAIFPYFLAVLVPTGIAYYLVQAFFRKTTRELKRLDSIMRSPLFAHFSSGLTGLATIRAYGVQAKFAAKNLNLLDWTNRAYFPLLLSQRWLGLRLEAIASLLILCAAVFAVAARFSVGASLAGLTISYALQITGVLNWCVREFTELEQHMVSAERILEFDELKEEAALVVPGNRPPAGWPHQGEIQIRDLQLRYREGLPLVLNGITATIKPGEKVAIVGRTGAGKSTIILALLRLVEPSGGDILIDGLRTSDIGLYDLRKSLAVIPQDPVLFSGTLRTNLDPFGEHTDEELWNALERSDLKDFVAANPKRLEMPVTEGGENWSTGQRQLICLARAVLRDAKIVILDEATASVDLATDEFIQKAIRRDFKDKTVLTIAHRLNTVIDYDRILLLDKGRVGEFDTPANLLSDPTSQFFSMVADTGEANAEMLKGIANRKSGAVAAAAAAV
ncbi:hypothetical protein HDU96_000305 [Phlyctochytrium bullatum]|nr:hypothetical protein HDU96_000305 [Phlyctochytrium bullatum]